MAGDPKATVTMADLLRLSGEPEKRDKLSHEDVTDMALAAMVVLRGLTRGDKLRTIARMRKMVGR